MNTINDEPMQGAVGRLLIQVYNTHQQELRVNLVIEHGFIEHVKGTHSNRKALNENLNDLQKKINILEAEKKRLEDDFHQGTEQNEQLLSENKRLQLQITKLKEKPQESCKSCERLRRKVKSLSSVKEQIFNVLAGTENKGQKRPRYVDSITNTIQTLYTQAFDSDDEDEEPNSDQDPPASSPESSPQKPRAATASPLRQRMLNNKTKTLQNSPSRLGNLGKSKSLGAVQKRASPDAGIKLRGKGGARNSFGTTRGAEAEQEEESFNETLARDGTKPQKNLRLSRVKKRSRFTEVIEPIRLRLKLIHPSPNSSKEMDDEGAVKEGQPNSKRFKNLVDEISPKKKPTDLTGLPKQPIIIDLKDSDIEEVDAPLPPQVLAPETCEVPLDTSQVQDLKKASSSNLPWKFTDNFIKRKKFQDRPDLVIPETVPMAFSEEEDEEGEEEQGEERGSQASTTQVTVRHVELSPPSHSSTPVCINNRSKSRSNLNDCNRVSSQRKGVPKAKSPKHKSQMEGSGKTGPLRRARHMSSTEDSNDEDCAIGEPGSPVFNRNRSVKAQAVGRTGEVQSPCLFDEDEKDSGGNRSDNDDDSLPPGLINQQNLNRKPSQRQAKRELAQKKKQLQESYQENEAANESTVSNPSPSVLTGRLMSRLAEEPKSGWLSTSSNKMVSDSQRLVKNPTARLHLGTKSDSPARSQNVSDDVIVIQTGPSSGRSQPKGRINEEVDGILPETSSPVRLTRSKHKKQSQESPRRVLNTSTGNNNLNSSKTLKQTTISQKFFNPPKTFLPTAKGFNGGRLPGSSQRQLTTEEKELQDLEEAMQRSLEDLRSRPSQYYEMTYEDPDMTGPQFTSTPCVAATTIDRAEAKRSNRLVSTTSEEDSTCSESTVFKKPSTPTTPKHRRPSKELEMTARRSPRLSELRESQDDTIDPTTQSHHSPGRTSPGHQSAEKPTGRSGKPDTTGTRRSLHLGTEDSPSETGAPASEMMTMLGAHHHGNGSLDPDVHLSQWDQSTCPVAAPPDHVLSEHFQEPVSFLELCAEESENRTQKSQTRSQAGKVNQGRRAVRQVNDPGSDDDDGIELSAKSVVFGPSKVQKNTRQATKDNSKQVSDERQKGVQEEDTLDDSFDIVPKKAQPNYAYVDVVRKRAEREQLQTYACPECEKYFRDQDLSEEELKSRMKACRHKARFVPPGTPDNFWTVGFPDTQECEERGYLNKTQHKPSNHRRQKALKALFKSSKKGETSSPPQDVGGVTDLFEGDDTI